MDATKPPAARVVRCDAAELTAVDHERIFSFITKYSLYDRATLDTTLAAATYVWLCLDSMGRLVGTTAVRRLELDAGVGDHRRRPTVVYTSVVAVDPAYRGQGLPARMGLKTYIRERMRSPFTPLYWLAEAVSPSGYLLMARNFAHFWPQPGIAVPNRAKSVIGVTLAAAGVTRIDRSGHAHLVHEDYPVIEREQAPDRWDSDDPDIGFFLRTNPDYWTGTALVCLAPLNLIGVARAVAGVALKVLRHKSARGKKR